MAEAEHKANELYMNQMKKQQQMKDEIDRSRKIQIDRKKREKGEVAEDEDIKRTTAELYVIEKWEELMDTDEVAEFSFETD